MIDSLRSTPMVRPLPVRLAATPAADRFEPTAARLHMMTAADARQLSVPQDFSQKSVQSYYLSADEETLSPAGIALYASVRSKYLDGVPVCPVGSPTVTFTGGLPGSGKSAILKQMFKDPKELVMIDPDQLKFDVIADLATINPGLRGPMTSDKEWGTVVHWTSSLLAKQLIFDAVQSGKDIVFDSSMSSPEQDKYRQFVASARSHGYRVNAIISNVGVDKSIQRSASRAEHPVTIDHLGGPLVMPGRAVQPDYIRECATRLEENLRAYVGESLFDNVTVFNNNVDGAPAELLGSYNHDDQAHMIDDMHFGAVA